MRKINLRRAAIALLLLVFLFLWVPILLSTTTKSIAAPVAVTVLPTIITTIPDPISTVRPKPTPRPKPTATPFPTATPIPTATVLPTATPMPTTVPSPTVGITPTVTVRPTSVPTQKASPVAKPTAHPTATAITKRPTATSPEHSPIGDNVPVMPIVIGTLLTLCLGAGGFISIRRVRTAVASKKQQHAPSVQSWQRVRTMQTPVPPPSMQETLPFLEHHEFSSPQEDVALSTPVNEAKHTHTIHTGPQTGSHRRLGPVRLQKMTPNDVAEPELPKEAQVPPTDFEDMSFLDDQFLQDTLRHYRQKGQK